MTERTDARAPNDTREHPGPETALWFIREPITTPASGPPLLAAYGVRQDRWTAAVGGVRNLNRGGRPAVRRARARTRCGDLDSRLRVRARCNDGPAANQLRMIRRRAHDRRGGRGDPIRRIAPEDSSG